MSQPAVESAHTGAMTLDQFVTDLGMAPFSAAEVAEAREELGLPS
jgi:phage terminase small subunit